MTMHLIGIDTETGGFYPAINALLSVALVPSWDAPETTIYILPEPGKIIEPDAARINGYTPELWAERGALPLRLAMLMLAMALDRLRAEKKEARLVAHNAGFDKTFLEEAARPFDIQMPIRHAWRCSMQAMGMLMDDGLISQGSLKLDRLGELAGLWPIGGRPSVHDVTEDARATLQGYQWLLEKKKSTGTQIWRNGIPALASGKACQAIVCYQLPDGKRTVTTAIYMQDYWMDWADDADLNDEENSSGDLSSRPLEANVIAWLPLPSAMWDDNTVSWPILAVASSSEAAE